MGRREELTDEQWEIIEPLIPEPSRRDDGKGGPTLLHQLGQPPIKFGRRDAGCGLPGQVTGLRKARLPVRDHSQSDH